MLTPNKLIIKQDNLTIEYLKQFNIICNQDSLAIFAEAIDNNKNKYYYVVEKIESNQQFTIAHVKAVSQIPLKINIAEIIDIRDHDK